MSTSDGENNMGSNNRKRKRNHNHDDNGTNRNSKKNDWPQTVEEAVDRLLQGLSEQDKQTVRSTPKDELYRFHFGWGMGIRNAYGLWQGNAALMQSCAEASGYGPDGLLFMHPDDASGVIIEAVWQRLQQEQ